MNKRQLYPTYFIFAALLLYALLFLIPSLIGLGYSLTDWNTYSDTVSFVGLSNYVKILFSGNIEYLSYIKNTIFFSALSIIVKTVLALILALLLTTGIRFTGFHRVIAFTPQILSFLIVGLVFKGILHPTSGFLNGVLRSIGLGYFAKDWLGDIRYAFFSIVGVDAWKGVGFGMVIFIAGIQTIPKTYYEAASIDGAGFWKKLLNITLPFLRPTIVINVVLSLTYGLRVFDIVYVLTNGGPGYATDVINTAVFRFFSTGDYAMGTTLSSLLSLFTILLSFFIIKGLNSKVEE